MADVVGTIQAALLLTAGISAIVWFLWGFYYRMRKSNELGIGLFDVETPSWHQKLFWPILLLLVIGNLWTFLM